MAQFSNRVKRQACHQTSSNSQPLNMPTCSCISGDSDLQEKGVQSFALTWKFLVNDAMDLVTCADDNELLAGVCVSKAVVFQMIDERDYGVPLLVGTHATFAVDCSNLFEYSPSPRCSRFDTRR